MKRRSFLSGAGTAAVAAAALPAPAVASGRRRLRMVTTWPKNLPGLGISPERLAKRVEAMTDGEIEIEVLADREFVPALQAFDTVASGAADAYNGAEYYWQGKSKAYNFFTAVPFGMTAAEINAWIYHGGGQELWDELAAQFQIKPFMSANTGVQMGGWYRREINSLEDLKGLKVRMPGLGGEVMRRAGAAALTLEGSLIYQSLQQGQIDAAEWVGPWNDMALGLHEVAQYYYWPGFHEPGSSLATGFNLDVWNSLTPSQQEAIKTACAAENDYTLAEFNHYNSVSLTVLEQEHKEVGIRRFSPEVLAELKKHAISVLEEAAAGDAFTARVYDSFKQALARSRKWTRVSEQAYVEGRGV